MSALGVKRRDRRPEKCEACSCWVAPSIWERHEQRCPKCDTKREVTE